MLSIRTQDRMALVPYRDAIKINGSDNEWHITTIYTEWNLLGTYATNERALEVLDEIQQHVVGKIIMQNKALIKAKDDYRKNNMTLPPSFLQAKEEYIKHLPQVYEMPKE